MPKIPYRYSGSTADLDDYIRANLDVRSQQRRQSDSIIEAEQNAKRQRQLQQDALDQANQQNTVGTVTQLGTTAAMLAGKEGIAKGAGLVAEGAYNLLPETAQNYIASLYNVPGQMGGVGASELTSTVSPVAESMATTGAETTGGFFGADAAVTPSLSEAGMIVEPTVATTAPSSLATLGGTTAEVGAAPIATTVAEGGAEVGLGTTVGEMGAAAMPYLGPVAAGFAAPGIINAIHKDSMENLGHNLSFGLIKNEKTSSMLGSAATGAAAGAAIGSVVPVVGTLVGGVVGGVAGLASSVIEDIGDWF